MPLLKRPARDKPIWFSSGDNLKFTIKTPFLSQLSVVYRFVCPGCKSCYVGKSNHTYRTKEHTYTKGNKNKQNTICEHLSSCSHYSHIANLFKSDTNNFNSNQFSISQIRENTIIVDRGNNWNILLSKEALMIKEHRSSLNCGLKASKELQLFWLCFNILFDILFIVLISN